MKWISVKDIKPENGTWCLIVSNCGWIGLAKYSDVYEWSTIGFPDVIIDKTVYDVPNDQITYYVPLDLVTLPEQPVHEATCLLCGGDPLTPRCKFTCTKWRRHEVDSYL